MSKEKQIEEIGVILSDALHENNIAFANYMRDSQNHPAPMGDVGAMADALYNAGYRKQSGWISVDERLPEESGEYLVYTALGNRMVLDYSAKHKLFNCSDGCSREYAKCVSVDVAYWMPLPDAPEEGEKNND